MALNDLLDIFIDMKTLDGVSPCKLRVPVSMQLMPALGRIVPVI
jgi:hypothetical protein